MLKRSYVSRMWWRDWRRKSSTSTEAEPVSLVSRKISGRFHLLDNKKPGTSRFFYPFVEVFLLPECDARNGNYKYRFRETPSKHPINIGYFKRSHFFKKGKTRPCLRREIGQSLTSMKLSRISQKKFSLQRIFPRYLPILRLRKKISVFPCEKAQRKTPPRT